MTYITTPQKKKRRGAYFLCDTCKKEFYVFPSYIRKAEKKNIHIRFCSMKCYDKTGEKNPFWGKKHTEESIRKMAEHPNRPSFKHGKLNYNFIRFGEEYGFKGSHYLWWRRKLLKDIGKCEKCGFDIKRILILHHKDRNRSNNERENLELLCWNCHMLGHEKKNDGTYHFKNFRK